VGRQFGRQTAKASDQVGRIGGQIERVGRPAGQRIGRGADQLGQVVLAVPFQAVGCRQELGGGLLTAGG
jgi:hypothetical protein